MKLIVECHFLNNPSLPALMFNSIISYRELVRYDINILTCKKNGSISATFKQLYESMQQQPFHPYRGRCNHAVVDTIARTGVLSKLYTEYGVLYT